MSTRILTIWMPPSSFYKQEKEKLYCVCGEIIMPAAAFTIEEHEFESIGEQYCCSIRCLKCSLKIYETEKLEEKIRAITREELKRIFREEIANPDGDFGPKKEVPF